MNEKREPKSNCPDCYGTGRVLYQPIGTKKPNKVECHCCRREPAQMRMRQPVRQMSVTKLTNRERWQRGMNKAAERQEAKDERK